MKKLLLLACMAMPFMGCSAVGFLTGTVIDNSRADTAVYNMNKVDKLRKNRSVVLVKKDSTTLEGVFRGIMDIPDSVYSSLFTADDSLTAVSPHPGEQVEFVLSTGESGEGMFLGYDKKEDVREMIGPGIIRYGKLSPYALHITTSSGDLTDYFYLNLIEKLSNRNGTSYDCVVLRDLAESNDLPTPVGLTVDVSSYEFLVPLDEVISAEQVRGKNMKWNLLAVGLGIDAAIIALFIAFPFGNVGPGM